MDKPTLQISILREPMQCGQYLLQALLGQDYQGPRWWDRTESERYNIEFFIGAPPTGESHGAVIVLDAFQKRPVLLRQYIQSAKQRGLRFSVAVLVYFDQEQRALTEELPLLDAEEKEAREFLHSCGLAGDEIPFFRETLPTLSFRGELLSFIEENIPFVPVPERINKSQESQLWRFVRKVVFSDEVGFDNELWSAFRRGELGEQHGDSWKLHSIIHQGVCGYFGDTPELLFLFASDTLLLRLLTHMAPKGLRELYEKIFRCPPIGPSLYDTWPQPYVERFSQFTRVSLSLFNAPFYLRNAIAALAKEPYGARAFSPLKGFLMIQLQTGQELDAFSLRVWLESADLSLYQDGHRYFYGHLIPSYG